MKTLIGILAALISMAFICLLILRIWDIQIVSLQTIIRSSATLITLGIAAVALLVIYGGFLRSNNQAYNKNAGRRAHPKI